MKSRMLKIHFSLALGATALLAGHFAHAAACGVEWPQWQQFADRWVQDDGRVLESSLLPNHSTSEGQAYALFFSLIGNDKARFKKIWRWTRENLAGNTPENRLPAWLWGKGKDGSWGIQDQNPASDADLWLAYSLLEADRLWNEPNYRAEAERLLRNIKTQEVADLPGIGAMLLPGVEGFVQPDHLWRLNPSYLPLPVLRRLTRFDPAGPWQAIVENTVRLLEHSGAYGFAADWVGYRATSEQGGIFVVDPFNGDIGSYDAIRVYLWAGVTASTDPLASRVLASLKGMVGSTASRGIPPEKVAVQQGRTEGDAPLGFSAALVPYFRALNHPWLADLQYQRAADGLKRALSTPQKQGIYYDYMLSLFGLGWADKRYQFDVEGKIHTCWEPSCSNASR